MDQHRMTYQAGLVIDRIPTEPFWFCPCGRFRFAAKAMPHRKAGNNKVEAERAFATHLRVHQAADPPPPGAGLPRFCP